MGDPTKGWIMIGSNETEGIVKIRACDPDSPKGWVQMELSPTAARKLADWMDNGMPGKTLRITDGQRYALHELTPEAARSEAANLRLSADRAEGKPEC